MKQLSSSLIKLAENPLKKSDDDSMDYQEEEKAPSMEVEKLDNGRKVSGPRTKLSNAAEERFERIENALGALAKSMGELAKSNSAMLKGFGGGGGFPPPAQEEPMPPMEDDFGGDMGGGAPDPAMGGGDEFGAQDDLDLGAGDMFGGEFDPYGGEQQAQMRGGDVTMQLRPDQMVHNARLAKDDSSSNFGEKDSDIPGNRRLDPDNKDKSADEVLIQGGEGAGYSVNKAFAKAVAQELYTLNKSRVSKSTNSPDVANSQISKGEVVDSGALMQSAVKLSFAELNRKRVEVGDLADGIL